MYYREPSNKDDVLACLVALGCLTVTAWILWFILENLGK